MVLKCSFGAIYIRNQPSPRFSEYYIGLNVLARIHVVSLAHNWKFYHVLMNESSPAQLLTEKIRECE